LLPELDTHFFGPSRWRFCTPWRNFSHWHFCALFGALNFALLDSRSHATGFLRSYFSALVFLRAFAFFALYFPCAIIFSLSFFFALSLFVLSFLCAFAFLRSFFFVLLLFSSCFASFVPFFLQDITFFLRTFAFLHSFLLFHSIALVLFFFVLLLFSRSFFFLLLLFYTLFSLRFQFFALFFLCGFAFFTLFFLHFLAFLRSFFFALLLFPLFFFVLSLFLHSFFFALCFFRALFLRSFDHNGISAGIYRKTATPCCDDVSSIYTRPSAAKKYFLQGPCFYGQRRLCLALCILSSLYDLYLERKHMSGVGKAEILSESPSESFSRDFSGILP
jgi:hypothetical protein